MDGTDAETRADPLLHDIPSRTSVHGNGLTLEHQNIVVVGAHTPQDGKDTAYPLLDNYTQLRDDGISSACDTVIHDCASTGEYIPMIAGRLHQHNVSLQPPSEHSTSQRELPISGLDYGMNSAIAASDPPHSVLIDVASRPEKTVENAFGSQPQHSIAAQKPRCLCRRLSALTFEHDYQQEHNQLNCEITGCEFTGPSIYDIRPLTMETAQKLTAWGSDLAGVGAHLSDFSWPNYVDSKEIIID